MEIVKKTEFINYDLYFKKSDNELGIVIELLGYSRIKILSVKNELLVCKIPGKLKKRYKKSKYRVNIYDYVIFNRFYKSLKGILVKKIQLEEKIHIKKKYYDFKESSLSFEY